MRAAVTDARLEAVAGQPVFATRTPSTFNGGSATHHTIVAGIPTGFPADGSGMILAFDETANAFNAQIVGPPPQFSIRRGAMTGTSGPVFWASSSAPGRLHLGLHSYQPHRGWQGPFAAAVYDRVLTDREARAVAHHLAATL